MQQERIFIAMWHCVIFNGIWKLQGEFWKANIRGVFIYLTLRYNKEGDKERYIMEIN